MGPCPALGLSRLGRDAGDQRESHLWPGFWDPKSWWPQGPPPLRTSQASQWGGMKAPRSRCGRLARMAGAAWPDSRSC